MTGAIDERYRSPSGSLIQARTLNENHPARRDGRFCRHVTTGLRAATLAIHPAGTRKMARTGGIAATEG